MLDHGAKAPAGRSITPHVVGPIHTPMMGEEASLLGALARAKAFPVASITPLRGFDVEEVLSMAVDNDHARSEHPLQHTFWSSVCAYLCCLLLKDLKIQINFFL